MPRIILANIRPLLLTVILAFAAPTAMAAPITLQNATASFSQVPDFPVTASIDGNLGGAGSINGWATFSIAATAVYETQTNVGGTAGATFTFTLIQNYGSANTLGKFRLSVTADNRSTFADGLNSGGAVAANWTVLTPLTATATNGTILTAQPDQSILASGVNPAASVYTVTAATTLTNITGVRLEALQDPTLPVNGPGRSSNGNFVLQELQVDAVAVPEPAMLGVFALATALLCRRRRSPFN
jgi:hypothetical protein